MDLISISYKNIWPFKDRLISIFFDNWKYLVKSPIGTWKSFLFFDWPIYALYKYSNRNLLNINNKSWFIKILFDFEWEKYLIVRNITKWKLKDICQSELFKIEWLENIKNLRDKNELKDDVFLENLDIEDVLKNDKNINIEEIKFKNESNLQLHLNSFLQPKEVFLSTVFLMQDMDNIFEMVPSERLNVLKNIFSLVGIDEAKEEIVEKKREIVAKIKANEDNTNYNIKLRKLLAEYILLFDKIKKEKLEWLDLSEFDNFFDNINLIKGKININEFSMVDFPKEIWDKISDITEGKKTLYQKLSNEKEQLWRNKLEFENKNKNVILSEKNLKEESDDLEKKIRSIDPNRIKTLKGEKQIILSKQIELEKSVNIDEFERFLNNNPNLINAKTDKLNLNYCYILVRDLINKWKLKDGEKQSLLLEISNFEYKINAEIKSLEEKRNIYNEQRSWLKKRLEEFDNNIKEQEKFMCEKIWENCPFVKAINKKTFDSLENQRSEIMGDIQKLAEKINSELIEEKIDNLKKDMENSKSIKKSLEEIEKEIFLIKEFLQKIDYKKIENINQEYQNNEVKIKEIDKEILSLESDFEKLKDYEIQMERNKVKIDNLKIEKEETVDKINLLERQINELEYSIKKVNILGIKDMDNLNNRMKETYRDLDSLIEDFKRNQILISALKDDEKVLNDLYLILSKELLLLVLQDNLPILNDIVNVYLNQSVDYQVNFELTKTSSDKLELEIKILHDKWNRDVKSLSGWQKIILKLVWMLAISSYIRSPILFLDETINNLDTDTVWKVADMLEDFVRSRNMKFYVVTHSQQIQDMDIRDKTIEIWDIKE